MSELETNPLAPLPPMPQEARDELAASVVEAARQTFGAGLVTVIGKGSAFKGDFIPYYSDFDVHVFVDSRYVTMLGPRTPALEQAMTLQRSLGKLDPDAFRVNSLQVFVVDAYAYPEDWTPPLPGTYNVLYGEYPQHLGVPSAEELRALSRLFFNRIQADRIRLIERFLDKPDTAISPLVRLMGCFLKPSVYHVAILQGADPAAVWLEPLGHLVPTLAALDAEGAEGVKEFFISARSWETVRHDPERLRTMFQQGSETLGWICTLMECLDGSTH